MSYGSPTGNQGYPDPTNYEEDSSFGGYNAPKLGLRGKVGIVMVIFGICAMLVPVVFSGVFPYSHALYFFTYPIETAVILFGFSLVLFGFALTI
jgi:hypothetical protein